MSTTQLKRYKVKPECWTEFMDTWRELVVLRKKHGFGILFVLRDPETNWFTWAIDHTGDFDSAAEAYYQDPDRVALDRIADYVGEWEITKVEAIAIP